MFRLKYSLGGDSHLLLINIVLWVIKLEHLVGPELYNLIAWISIILALVGLVALLKVLSFLFLKMYQWIRGVKTNNGTRILPLSLMGLFDTLKFIRSLNKWSYGGLNWKWDHITLAFRQFRRSWMWVSIIFEQQWQESIKRCLFLKISTVWSSLVARSHMKFLILLGAFIFQTHRYEKVFLNTHC